MQINKILIKTKCDFPGCKNMATSTIGLQNDFNKKLNFCDECLNSIYTTIAKVIVPKGIEPPFKKQKKIK